MAALAGIGDMPDTIEDRAVVIGMRRRAPDETVQPYRARRDGPALRRPQAPAAPLGPRPPRPARQPPHPTMPVGGPRRRHLGTPRSPSPTSPAATGPPTPAPPSSPSPTDDGDVDERVPPVRLLIDCRTAFGDADALPTGDPARPAPRRPRSALGHPRQERAHRRVARRPAARLRHPLRQPPLARRHPEPRATTATTSPTPGAATAPNPKFDAT